MKIIESEFQPPHQGTAFLVVPDHVTEPVKWSSVHSIHLTRGSAEAIIRRHQPVQCEFLYGEEDDEYLETDPHAYLERWLDIRDPEEWGTGPKLVEYDVYTPRHHLPSVDAVLDWISRTSAESGEVVEEWWDHAEAAITNPATEAIVDALLDIMAEKISFRMAHRITRTLRVRRLNAHDGSVHWMIDNERSVVVPPDDAPGTYVPAAQSRIHRVYVEDGIVLRPDLP